MGNKAREINSPVIKQLLDETTPEELAKIDTEMTNNKQQTAIGIVNHKIDNLEWAFQFNNDVPVMIAEYINGKREMNLTIGDTSTSNIVFSDGNGNTFKIFAREKGGNNE
jgi:hypothetical protein